MALTPATLPDGYLYPASVQTLLEIFAAYLTAPTGVKALYVASTAPTGVPEETGWYNTSTGAFSVWATISPETTPSWHDTSIPNGAVTTVKIADLAVTREKLDATLRAVIDSVSESSIKTVVGLEEPGLGSTMMNFFIMADGTLRVTGKSGTHGRGGFGEKTSSSSDNSYLPKRCGFSPPLGSSAVEKVYALPESTFVVTDDGRVYATGLNDLGQLGLGDTTHRFVFTEIAAAGFASSPVTKLAFCSGEGVYFSAFALTEAGKVYSWGINTRGQLGLNNTTDQTSPQYVTTTLDPLTITDIVAGGCCVGSGVLGSVYALDDDGLVYACGFGGEGQLGNGSTSDVDTFTAISTPGALITQIAVASGGIDAGPNYRTTVAVLRADGKVRTFGSGAAGQLGNVSTTNSSAIETVWTDAGGTVELTGVESLTGFYKTFYAITSAGALYGWGHNGDGNLGLNDQVNKTRAMLIEATDVATITAGGNSGNVAAIYTLDDGTVWGMGYNAKGVLGLGNITAYIDEPTQMLIDTEDISLVRLATNWAVAAAGTGSTLVLTGGGQALACGYDASGVGQLGVDASPLPISVPSFVNF